MTESDQPAKPRLSRGLRFVFGLSLALNLLVVAAVGGAWLRHGGPPREGTMPGGMAQLLYWELSREDRRALRRNLRQKLDRSLVMQTRVAPELLEVLRAEPFELAALQDLLSQHSSALQIAQDTMRSEWLAIMEGMNREERLVYADRLSEALKKSRKARRPDAN